MTQALPAPRSHPARWAALAFGLAALAGPLQAAGTSVLRAPRLIAAPGAVPIDDAVVLMRDGRIVAAGPRAAVVVPEGSTELGCSGAVVTAGFQNSHVHFTGPAWSGAATREAAGLEAALAAMLGRYGFTTVVDTASDPRDTFALRRRIESGELKGPRILGLGSGIYPAQGLPFYLAGLPPAVREQLPQPATPEAAAAVVRTNLGWGADGTKLFIATPQADRSVRHMSAAVARAAADETHRAGKLAMAHPTDVDGLRAATAAGVDVLLHSTLGVPEPWPAPLVKQMVDQRMSLVPTLKLWHHELDKVGVPPAVQERLVAATQQQVKQFADAGGQLLFGTDVGYMTDHDTTQEYRLMAGAGLSGAQILASLTTAPAARWGESDRRGRVEPGQAADLVVLGGDPMADATKFADVRCTVRSGRVIFSR